MSEKKNSCSLKSSSKEFFGFAYRKYILEYVGKKLFIVGTQMNTLKKNIYMFRMLQKVFKYYKKYSSSFIRIMCYIYLLLFLTEKIMDVRKKELSPT